MIDVAIASIQAHFFTLLDSRRVEKCLCRKLMNVILMAICAVIIGAVPNFSIAELDTDLQFPLNVLHAQVAEHRPFWTEQQRSTLIDTIRLAFEEGTPDNMEARVQMLTRFFPSYLTGLPWQITDDESEFLCQRTKWHIERFLSNPLLDSEDLSNLRSQIESLISAIQDEDMTVVVPQELKGKAKHIILETVTKVAQNPLVPILKRSLTVQELATAKATILERLHDAKTPTITSLTEDELLQWYLSKISVVIQVVSTITMPASSQSLVEKEQEYLRSVRVREQFETGHGYFLSMLASPVESIGFMEFFFRESLALHRTLFSTQLQFLIGY